MVKNLRGSGFDSRHGLWKFSNDPFLLFAFSSSGIHSASTTNEYQGISFGVKCGRRVELTTLPSQLCTVKVKGGGPTFLSPSVFRTC